MIMKRFAARRIYLSSEQRMLDLHVVELDDSGIVRTVFPLREEISHTEWVSGIIVIAPGFPPRRPEEPFSGYADRLRSQPAAHRSLQPLRHGVHPPQPRYPSFLTTDYTDINAVWAFSPPITQIK